VKLIEPQKLTRNRVVIPIFTLEYLWAGFEDMMAFVRCKATHNFSILSTNIPEDAPYVVCVFSDGKRFRLGGATSTSFQDYSGQKILKDFRIEFWSSWLLATSTPTNELGYSVVRIIGEKDQPIYGELGPII
jgi:hypothetical protein